MTAPQRQGRPVVIDASLALKWQFDDEEHVAEALALRDGVIISRSLLAYAPTLFPYELINGVVSAVRRKRLDTALGERALRNLLSVDIKLRTPSADKVFASAIGYALSAYDGSYVALAEDLGAELWTADRRLYDAVSGRLSWVHWVGDYSAGSP